MLRETRVRTVAGALLLCGLLAVGAGGVAVAAAIPQTFDDVPPAHWAFTNIASLTSMGVIKGLPDGTFRPADGVTRDQLSVALERGLRAVGGRVGWARPGEAANTVLVFAPILVTAVPADFRLLESDDGVTYTPAANATFLGVDEVNGFAVWSVTGVTTTTFFRPEVAVGSQHVILTGSPIQARPQVATTGITITLPADDATDVSRLPVIRWNAVDNAFGTEMYIVGVENATGTPVTTFYEVGLEAWRTSVMVNQLRGPGVIFSLTDTPFVPPALAANTEFTAVVLAVDVTGWTFARGEVTFTTAP